MCTLVYLSLGSNLGDREHNLEAALRLIEDQHLRVKRRSSIYETEPRDYTDQPWFLNMVAEVETTLTPRALLDRVRQAEDRLHRQREIDKGPRTVDIDILAYGDLQIVETDLVVPHPRMTTRRFVLEPLNELVPHMRFDPAGPTVSELVLNVADQPVRRWP
jgi:2-amino-4-hydroxy-6-hydroxymethyldihydropteridine diphosphokinase